MRHYRVGRPAIDILLTDPKYPHNVGSVIRAAAGYGAKRVIWTGDRVTEAMANAATNEKRRKRIPREERLYHRDVRFYNSDAVPIIDWAKDGYGVVAVELVPGAMPLPYYEHPERAIYLFGPEDGTLSKEWRKQAHDFVFIPTRHCINLAAAVYTVLYDRQFKEQMAGRLPVLSMEETLKR